jgi:hypothetical protein
MAGWPICGLIRRPFELHPLFRAPFPTRSCPPICGNEPPGYTLSQIFANKREMKSNTTDNLSWSKPPSFHRRSQFSAPRAIHARYMHSTYEAFQRSLSDRTFTFPLLSFNSLFFHTGVTLQLANASHRIRPAIAEDARTYRLTLAGRSTVGIHREMNPLQSTSLHPGQLHGRYSSGWHIRAGSANKSSGHSHIHSVLLRTNIPAAGRGNPPQSTTRGEYITLISAH